MQHQREVRHSTPAGAKGRFSSRSALYAFVLAAASGAAAAARTLNFPPESLGELLAVPAEDIYAVHQSDRTTSLGKAAGSRTVPDDCLVELRPTYRAVNDLRVLRALRPQDIDSLDMSRAEIKDQISELNRFTQLQRLNLRITDADGEALSKLTKLTRLAWLDLTQTNFTDADLPVLKQFPTLLSLRLIRLPITDRGVAALAALPRLQALSLSGTNVTGAGLENLKSLVFLDLSGTRFNDATAAHLSSMKSLRDLRINDNAAFTSAGLVHLAPLSLTTLNISGTGVTGGLSCLKGSRQLKVLLATDCSLTDASLAQLRSFPQLEYLSLQKPRKITGAGLKHLAALPRLQRLNLAESPIDDATFSRLPPLPQLTALALHDTHVGSATIERLSKTCPALVNLNLSRTRIDDAGLAFLARLQKLQSLALAETAISDRSLDTLSHLPNLLQLDVRATRVTPEAVARFRKAKPSCKLLHR